MSTAIETAATRPRGAGEAQLLQYMPRRGLTAHFIHCPDAAPAAAPLPRLDDGAPKSATEGGMEVQPRGTPWAGV
eukprot:COSAG06_NODE_4226_length_4451_cov_6.710018_4_plen_75_part_00